MTRHELQEYGKEIDQITEEMDWRCPNIEWQWFDWAERRLSEIIATLEESEKLARRREIGLRLVS